MSYPLTSEQQAKVRFHLAYNLATPAGDHARLFVAMNNVADEWTQGRLGDLITACDDAYDLTTLGAGTAATELATAVTGDVERTTALQARDPYNRRLRAYLNQTNFLASTLGVRNYRDPEQAGAGLIDDSVLLRTIPALESFETSDQLNTRDTNNRARANHTGTQTASTISDFQSAVSSNSDVAANTAARHEAVTVTDSAEIDLTLTGQNITASLSNSGVTPGTYGSGTQVFTATVDAKGRITSANNTTIAIPQSAVTNLSTDLAAKAPLTNPAFTGTELTLPNNSRINGIEHFYQATKPTTRGDGSALTVGDRWWKTDDGTEWFWNGTYWLSPQQIAIYSSNGNGFGNVNSSTANGSPYLSVPGGKVQKLLEYTIVTFVYSAGTHDGSNYFTIKPSLLYLNGTYFTTFTAQNTFSDMALVPSVRKEIEFPINVVVSNLLDVRFGYTKVGSPPALGSLTASLYYREIYP